MQTHRQSKPNPPRAPGCVQALSRSMPTITGRRRPSVLQVDKVCHSNLSQRLPRSGPHPISVKTTFGTRNLHYVHSTTAQATSSFWNCDIHLKHRLTCTSSYSYCMTLQYMLTDRYNTRLRKFSKQVRTSFVATSDHTDQSLGKGSCGLWKACLHHRFVP